MVHVMTRLELALHDAATPSSEERLGLEGTFDQGPALAPHPIEPGINGLVGWAREESEGAIGVWCRGKHERALENGVCRR